jgi:hypothetical protein
VTFGEEENPKEEQRKNPLSGRYYLWYNQRREKLRIYARAA